jgi:hypothetical protein
MPCNRSPLCIPSLWEDLPWLKALNHHVVQDVGRVRQGPALLSQIYFTAAPAVKEIPILSSMRVQASDWETYPEPVFLTVLIKTTARAAITALMRNSWSDKGIARQLLRLQIL